MAPPLSATGDFVHGLLGLLLSPRDQIDRMLMGLSRRRGPRALLPTTSGPVIPAISRARRASLFVTTWRVWIITTPRLLRYVLILVIIPAIALGILNFPLVSAQWLQFPMLLGFVTVRSREVLAFLTTRPISRLHLATALLLPPGVLVIALHLVWLAMVRSEVFIGPHAAQMVSHTVRPAEMLRFLHQGVGATFLPTRLPAGGLPAEVWPALRRLLFQHVVRVALLCIAFMYSIVGTGMAWLRKPELGWRPWGWRVLLIVCTLAAVLPCLPPIGNWRFPWRPAPLWLAAILALASIVSVGAQVVRPPRPHRR